MPGINYSSLTWKSFSLRYLLLIALFSAVSVALGFALIAIPNVELITVSVFIAGMLLGPFRGMMVGILAEFIFANFNPMGSSFPPLLIAQVISIAIAGLAGGYGVSIIKFHLRILRLIFFAFTGFIITLNYDFWTTLSFPLSAGFNYSQIVATFELGIPFIIPHLLSNTLIFALLLPPAYPRLRKLMPILLFPLILFLFMPCAKAGNPDLELNSRQWEYIYYQDTADILKTVPGFYHYDLALLGQPLYMKNGYQSPQYLLYGLPLNSRLFGQFDLNLFPPGYLDEIEISPVQEGFITSGEIISATPQFYSTEVPFSRVNYRDGYYGLGIADFIFAQKLRQNFGFQLGGQISEFNGRLENSKFGGTNLRGMLYWQNDRGAKTQFTYLSTRNKAGITFSSSHRNLFRTDLFLFAQRPLASDSASAVIHYYQSEEDYSGPIDPREKGADFKIQRNFSLKNLKFKPALYLDYYSVNSATGFEEQQASQTGSLEIEYPLSQKLTATTSASLTLSKWVLPQLGASAYYDFNPGLNLSASLVRSKTAPAPYLRADYPQNDNLFLPGSLSWSLSPDLQIQGNEDLNPETVNSARICACLKLQNLLELKPALLYQYVENPIQIVPTADPEIFTYINEHGRDFASVMMELKTESIYGFSLNLSHTYQNPALYPDFTPQNWGYYRLCYQARAFENQLLYTLDFHGTYIGPRSGMIKGEYWDLGDDNIWGLRFIAKVGDFTFFWGNENIFGREYEIIPGYTMMHREEIWGVNWIFWD